MCYLRNTSNVYLYCLDEHPMKQDADKFKYLSVRKVAKYRIFTSGETVLLLFRKNKYAPPGIIGFCTITGPLKKLSEISLQERYLCREHSMLQLPVADIQCSVSMNIIDEEVLYSLPYMNEYLGKLRVFKPYSLINIYIPILNILERYREYWFIWHAKRSEAEVFQYKRLFLHKEREYISHRAYLKLSKNVTRCSTCGLEHKEFASFTPRFFEFHEPDVNPIGKYVKVDITKFIPLCPSCHRIEHEKIVPQCFTDKSFGIIGALGGHLSCGWNTKYFKDEFEL